MKNIIIGLLFCVCVYLLFFKKSEKIVERIPEEVVRTVEVEVDRVIKKIDKEGFEHAVMEEVENYTRSYDSIRDSAKQEIDSIISLLEIKKSQLNSYISYSATLEDSLLKATRYTDTSFVYSDKYTKIEFVQDSLKHPYFNFSYDANVSYATYWKRDWIFGKKKGYIDFWIADSRATINGVKKLKIQRPERFFKIDINASSYYSNELHTGFDGGLNFGRLRLGAGYLYDTSVKEWHPVFTAKYNLLDL